ncbi:MAG: hypothetical protein MJ218_03170, partial [Opitutales bacterium]|nr:hypothetical protein [Opitutales bacterium]
MPEKPTIITLQDLKQLPIGTPFHTVAAVRHTERKTGKTGTPYLQVEVGDAIDHLNFTCFENQQPFAFFQQPVQRFPHIVQLEGTIDFYNKKLSPTIKSAKSLDGEDYEYYLPKVLEGPDEALEDLKQELQSWIEKIEQKELNAFTINFTRMGEESGLSRIPFVECCKAMERGTGYAGEGD